jgi:hypothetical protein
MPFLPAEIVPLLLMPPANVVLNSTPIAVLVAPAATILLLLSTLMPPETTPASKMPPPLMKAWLSTEMPPAPIVPVFSTGPEKVVALITIADVSPLKTVGYGPLKAMSAPSRAIRLASAVAPHPDCRPRDSLI